MCLPADASIDSVRRKVVYDLYYVRYVTPWLDIKLMCLTAWRLLRELSRFFRRSVVLPDQAEIERGYQRAAGVKVETIEAAPVTSDRSFDTYHFRTNLLGAQFDATLAA